MLDIRSIEEYNVVKYIRHKSERRTDESCERISQELSISHRTRQGYRCLETDHQYDWERQVQSNLNSVSISPATSKLTSTVSFGRKIFKKEPTHEKRNLHWKTDQTHIRHFWSLTNTNGVRSIVLGTRVFIVLFYLMIFGILFPLPLWL